MYLNGTSLVLAGIVVLQAVIIGAQVIKNARMRMELEFRREIERRLLETVDSSLARVNSFISGTMAAFDRNPNLAEMLYRFFSRFGSGASAPRAERTRSSVPGMN